MSDFKTYDPANFTTQELIEATRGGAKELKPQLAVTLLRAKLGDDAERVLLDLVRSDETDLRARHTATLALASFPAARQDLVSLAASPDRLIAQAATEALQQLPPTDSQ
jgi:hypothetical protein